MGTSFGLQENYRRLMKKHDKPLMLKSTAIWLVENTALTFQQIADFCCMHIFEVESIANGEYDGKLLGADPINNSQTTREEIQKGEADPNYRLQYKTNKYLGEIMTTKYIPRSKRHNKPDAILWIVKYYPNMSDGDICKLLGTTKNLIKTIRNKTHKLYQDLKAKNPVSLGLCTEAELDFMIMKMKRSSGQQ